MIEINPKNIFSKLMPYPVVFVSTVDGDNEPVGLACGWHMKCYMNPPMYAVAIKKGRYSESLIERSKEFVVSFPSGDLVKEIEYFGTHSSKEFEKFKETKIKTRKSQFLRTPLIEDATINMECFLENSYELGDHHLFVGKVVASYYRSTKKLLFYHGKNKGKRVFKEIE